LLLYFVSITLLSILSLVIFKKIKVILTFKELVESYKNYFLNLRKFSKNEITIKNFLISLRKIINLTFILILKVILIIVPFLILYLL
jgi:hypothetical protein